MQNLLDSTGEKQFLEVVEGLTEEDGNEAA